MEVVEGKGESGVGSGREDGGRGMWWGRENEEIGNIGGEEDDGKREVGRG